MDQDVVAEGGPVIAYDIDGSGPAAVFIHGITDDRADWDPVTRDLRDDLTCVRVDLRGHGGSEPGPPWDMDALANDVLRVIDHLELERPHVVGHSLGGMVATFLAGRCPVASVTNVDQPLRLDAFAAGLRELEPSLRGPAFPETLLAISHSLGFDRLPRHAQDRLGAHRLGADPATVLGIWDVVFTSSELELRALVEAATGQVTAPYVALHGSDPGDDYRTWLEASIPSSRFELWDGDGHYPHLVHPEEFRSLLLRLVAGTTTRTEIA